MNSTHHGVMGMKWGQHRAARLERAARTSSRDAKELNKYGYKEEAAAVQKVADKNAAKAKEIKSKTLSETGSKTSSASKAARQAKIEKAVKIGAVAAGTALAAYGTYKVSKLVSEKKVKPFTVDQLKSMGIDVFEPLTIEPDRIKF